jgi:hypothetical protein
MMDALLNLFAAAILLVGLGEVMDAQRRLRDLRRQMDQQDREYRAVMAEACGGWGLVAPAPPPDGTGEEIQP